MQIVAHAIDEELVDFIALAALEKNQSKCNNVKLSSLRSDCSHLALFAKIATLAGVQNDLFKLIAFEKIGHFTRVQNVIDILKEFLLDDLAVDQ